MKAGKVCLVGAGPGDPSLISRKGLECLAQADVIIYDRLLDERLLDSVSPQAERIYVGKSAGRHAREQKEINQLLVEKAKVSKSVVRLKGGDPFVLGRGGEEAEALKQNRIPFEVVPGVTSAVAVPAYAGIPVTHRGVASSFAVITGHEDPGKASSSIAWEKLATGVDTLIFLMGMQNLPEIVETLLEHGRLPDTPVAVIKDGTRPEQKTVVGSLKDIVAKVRRRRLSPPVVIVVGEVVRLREKLRWFDNRPLFGKRILVTRARHQVSALSKLLSEHGALPIELPAIEIQATANTEELDQAISNLKRYHWIVFTSVNGVEAFFHRLYSLNLDARALSGLKIGAIGPATAQRLEDLQLTVDYVPSEYRAEAVIDGLRQHGIEGKKVLLPRAEVAREVLPEELARSGADVKVVTAYKTIQPELDMDLLQEAKPDIITFTSSSTVSNFVSAVGQDNIKNVLNGTIIASIGPITADTASDLGLKTDIMPEAYTIPGLVEAIVNYFL